MKTEQQIIEAIHFLDTCTIETFAQHDDRRPDAWIHDEVKAVKSALKWVLEDMP